MYKKLLKVTPQKRKTVFKLARQGFYFTLLIVIVLALWKLSSSYGTETFAEYGIVENLQLGTLFLSTIVFLVGAKISKIYRPISLALASLTAFCIIRELDSFFEQILPIISWKFAYLFPGIATLYAFKNRKNLIEPLFEFLSSFAFDLMFTAMIVFIPLAQCIGHRPFITNSVGSSKNVFLIRRMAEESMELMAYVLIFLSAIEVYCGLLKKKN